jgi:hypothetical protein
MRGSRERGVARSRPPPGKESGACRDAGDGAVRRRVQVRCVRGTPHRFERPGLRLTTQFSGFSLDGEEPPPRVQAASESGRFHWFGCPRGDLNPETDEISLNLDLNSKAGEESPVRHLHGAPSPSNGPPPRGGQPSHDRNPVRRLLEPAPESQWTARAVSAIQHGRETMRAGKLLLIGSPTSANLGRVMARL